MGKINTDSKLWESAYSSYLKANPVKKYKSSKLKKVYVSPAKKVEGEEALRARLSAISRQIKELQKEKKEINKRLQPASLAYENKPFILYVLQLENNNWYIGITRNLDRRYKRHYKGKGAMWTKRHKPIAIYYTKQLDTTSEAEASYYEDELTLEYANNYGTHCVRGGGYCQSKPNWPDNLLGI